MDVLPWSCSDSMSSPGPKRAEQTSFIAAILLFLEQRQVGVAGNSPTLLPFSPCPSISLPGSKC